MASSPSNPPRSFAAYAASSSPILKLPHPYLTSYHVRSCPSGDANNTGATGWYHLIPHGDTKPSTITAANPFPPSLLTTAAMTFTEPQYLPSSARPTDANNTPWARARRNPAVTVRWTADDTPTVAQLWLLTYAVFTIRPSEEAFRLHLDPPSFSSNSSSATDTKAIASLARQLQALGLAIPHPAPTSSSSPTTTTTTTPEASELLISRSSFYQGAASPFGPRPVWTPLHPDLTAYPLPPPEYVASTTTSASSLSPPSSSSGLAYHPRRQPKPLPGSVVYSRWIPHLNETFSMVALDVNDSTHLDLFHAWQNDPRVSQGWNLTGSREQHAEYLRRVDKDEHVLAVMARFDETYFAYFEVYWAKEDPIGAYYSAHDYDRGRHSLVGDVRYRGPHRVSAWWSSLMHYLFLDDPRTMWVVGEPKYTNTSVLMYDMIHGFGLDKFIDLPHKRSALVRCSRERFFQLCPLDENDKVMGGTGVGLVPKL